MASAFNVFRHYSMLWWLTAVNVGIFVVLTAISFASPGVVAYFALPGTFESWLSRPWTLLTYMVTQVDFLHLLFNMLTLLWFGSLLRTIISSSNLLVLYIGGGLMGALFFMGVSTIYSDVAYHAPLLGASASVLSVMTTAACRMGNYRFHLFFLGDVKLKWVVIFMIILSFLNIGGGGSLGIAAHFGGVLFGLCYGYSGSFRNEGKAKANKSRKIRKPTASGARRVASVLEQNRLDKARLDELLDKIKVSGYDSLSRAERAELDEISGRISK